MKRRAFVKNSSFTAGAALLVSGLLSTAGFADWTGPGCAKDNPNEICALSTCRGHGDGKPCIIDCNSHNEMTGQCTLQ